MYHNYCHVFLLANIDNGLLWTWSFHDTAWWKYLCQFFQLIDSTAFARFDVLQLEASRGCRYDYVAIYEGNLINNTQLLGEILNPS